MYTVLTCSFLRSAARSALGFGALEVVEVLKLLLEEDVCSEVLLAFLTKPGCFGRGGANDSDRLDERAVFVKGIRCDNVPTLIATGCGFGLGAVSLKF